MTKYISKKDEWFVEGSEVELVTDCGPTGGIFCGMRKPQYEDELLRHPDGEPYLDEEFCGWDEFERIDD
jgi:hypothetical protein